MDGFEVSTMINRPIEEVFAVLSDLENDPKWRREWVEARQMSEGLIGIGTQFSLFGEFLGRRNEMVYEIIRYEPNHLTAWKTVSGPLPLTFQRTFERVDGGTQVIFQYEGEMRGFLKLIKPLLISAGKRALQGDFPGLKAFMESRAL